MQSADAKQFRKLLEGVFDFYGKPVSEFTASVWWEAMRPYEFVAVKDALNRHAVNPDNGQFLPKPADVVKLLQGSSLDTALMAWAKVDRAVRQVGTYASVVFDDPVIHRVIADMGGWVQLGAASEDEWPFRGKEFQNHYRAWHMRRPVDYPRRLIGIEEADNGKQGYSDLRVVMIGEPERCKAVAEGGSDRPALLFTEVKDAAKDLPQLAGMRKDAA